MAWSSSAQFRLIAADIGADTGQPRPEHFGRGVLSSSRSYHRNMLSPAFRQPHFAGPPRYLPHIRALARHGKALRLFGAWVERASRIAALFANPNDILRPVAGRLPAAPGVGAGDLRIVHRNIAFVPLADPDAGLAAAPDVACAGDFFDAPPRSDPAVRLVAAASPMA